ncbi:MAG: GIY-YIG nuclease family protein [Proteobacteria bacterium]|nr:GIY-YIG nuclease family protein [Pseudomonadota bacterium]
MKKYYIYIIFNKRNGTIYTGVTSDLVKRIWQHKNKIVDGFTKKYGLDKLGYYEVFDSPEMAIQREKQIKSWSRKKRLGLIEKDNFKWLDLYDDIVK